MFQLLDIGQEAAERKEREERYRKQIESYLESDEYIFLEKDVLITLLWQPLKLFEIFRIIPYSSKESFITGLQTIQYCKVKFVQPKTLSEWFEQIKRCIIFYKLLITINHSFDSLRKFYHIKYEQKILYKTTSFTMEFKQESMMILVKTGLGFTSGRIEIIDEPVKFSGLKENLRILLLQMKKELPESVFQTDYDKLKQIAQNDYCRI